MLCGFWSSLFAQEAVTPCKQAWQALIPAGRHQYDFAVDTRRTENGNEGYQEFARRVKRCHCKKDWTILIYMVADEELGPYAYADLYEMEAGPRDDKDVTGSGLSADVVVQVDVPNEPVRRLHMFQTSASYDPTLGVDFFRKGKLKDVKSPVVSMVPGKEETQSERLKAFLAWGVTQYPAEHYMVVVWGHGKGWAPRRWARRTAGGVPNASRPGEVAQCGPLEPFALIDSWPELFGGFQFDKSRNLFLDVQSLADVLGHISETSLGGKRIDIFVADSCLMQMVEVATELSAVARFVVGSAQQLTYLGLPYRRILGAIDTEDTDGPETDKAFRDAPRRVASRIPDLVKFSLQSGSGGSALLKPDEARKLTMSVLSSRDTIDSLIPALSAFSQAMEEYLTEPSGRSRGAMVRELLEMRKDGLKYAGSGDLMAHLWVLEVLVDRKIGEAGAADPAALRLKGAIQVARTALDRATVKYALGERYSRKDTVEIACSIPFRGVSAWFPSKHEFGERKGDFEKSLFNKYTNWSGWIQLLYPTKN